MLTSSKNLYRPKMKRSPGKTNAKQRLMRRVKALAEHRRIERLVDWAGRYQSIQRLAKNVGKGQATVGTQREAVDSGCLVAALSRGFTKVDQAGIPGQFVEYLNVADQQRGIQEFKNKSYLHFDLRKGGLFLDAGCGNGGDVRVLAEQLGGNGHVTGVDLSANMIETAKADSNGVANVSFQVGDITRIAFKNNTFDGVRAERTLQHLKNAKKALSELVRVAKPEARIVSAEPDWGTCIVNVSDQNLDTYGKLQVHRVRQTIYGWVGRRLLQLFAEAGLRDLRIDTAVLTVTDPKVAKALFDLHDKVEVAEKDGALTAAEASALRSEFDSRFTDETFFGAITGFIVSGVKLHL